MNGTSPAPTAPAAADRDGLDTLPKLLLRNAVQHADRPAMRHKDFGIWQTWTWAQLRDEVRAFADRPEEARARARRHGRHHRRQPAAPLCDVRGRAEPRRHSRPGLPGLGGRRDGLRARARRGAVRHRRGPGAGRQGHLHCRSAAQARAIVYDEERGLADLRSRPRCNPSSTCRARPRGDARQPGRRGLVARARSPRARARTSA